MVDRVYKEDLPLLRIALEELRRDFSKVDSRTDWVRLRIDPLLEHLDSLERLSRSGEFSQEFSRLRRGVKLFLSDLVYLRENVKGLQELLKSEKNRRKENSQALASGRASFISTRALWKLLRVQKGITLAPNLSSGTM